MSRFGKKLSRNETLDLLVEEGFSAEEAEEAVYAAERENAEFDYENEPFEVCVFRGSVNRNDYVVSAFYVFDSQSVRELEWDNLPWEGPDFYMVT